LKVAPIRAIQLDSFPIQPHSNVKTLAAFDHGYCVFALIPQLKLPSLFIAPIVVLHAPTGSDKIKSHSVPECQWQLGRHIRCMQAQDLTQDLAQDRHSKHSRPTSAEVRARLR
jgi:hypothetical protein